MRFQSLRMRGIRPFQEEVHVDLESLAGPIVAIHGPNGAGKSTLVEMLTAGAYRDTPTHGKLHTMATARDSYVEVVVENGKRYKVLHRVDSMNGKGESVVTNGAGPLWGDAKVSSFDGWSKKTFPDQSVYFAGPFGAQQSEGLLDLTSGDRMAVVLRALGIERYEAMAKDARDKVADAKQRLEVLSARIADEQARGLDVSMAEARLARARQTAGEADKALEKARTEVIRAQDSIAGLADARRAAQVHRDRLEELKSQQSTVSERLEAIGGQISSARATAARAPEIRAAVEQLAAMDVQLSEAKSEEARLRSEVSAATRAVVEAERNAEEAERRRDSANRSAESAEEEVRGLRTRIANNRAVLDQADEIRAAVAEAERLDSKIAALNVERDRANDDAITHATNALRWEREQRDALSRATSAKGRIEVAEARLADRVRVERAVRDLEARRDACGEAAQELLAAEEALEAIRGLRVAGDEVRIEGLRSGLSRIVQIEAGLVQDNSGEVAHDALALDDRNISVAKELPGKLHEAEDAVKAKREALEEARRILSQCESVASRAPDLDLASQDLEVAKRDHAQAVSEATRAEQSAALAHKSKAEIKQLEVQAGKEIKELNEARRRLASLLSMAKRVDTAEARIAELEPQLTNAEKRVVESDESATIASADLKRSTATVETSRSKVESVNAELDGILSDIRSITMGRVPVAKLSSQSDALARAEAAIAALEPQAAEAKTEIERVATEIEKLGERPRVPSPPDVEALEQAVRNAEVLSRDSHASIQLRSRDLEDAKESVSKLEDLDKQRVEVESEVSDWSLLAESLGREGIQAAEVDAATPELTALTNDLLHTCVGTRWTAQWETTRPDAKGKKQLEECRIRVIDTEDGGDRDGKEYSPGQRALLELGCSLALTMYACQKLGIERPTLVRDEADAPMTEEASAAYIPMLRRAAEIVDADKVLVITHHPNTVALADSRIHVHDGKVEVQ